MPRLFSFLVAAAAASSVLGATSTADAVPDFDVSKCLGRWFEVYNGGALGQAPHQRESRCGTVDLGLSVLPYTLSLHYAHQLPPPHTPPHTHNHKHPHRRLVEEEEETVPVVVRSVDGFVSTDPKTPTTLTLHTHDGPGSLLEVLGVGVEGDGYEWAVLGDGAGHVSVLTRHVNTFHTQHDAQVRALLSSLGVAVPRGVEQEQCRGYEGHDRLAPLAHHHNKHNNHSKPSIHTVPTVDVTAYTGRWFQVYANSIVMSTFERNGYCITADYRALETGGIAVHNTQNMGSPTGALSSIDGQAVASDPSQPAQLTVTFDDVPFPGQYWIIDLGPIEGGQYQYSVVTDKYAQTLFILARDPVSFKSRFESSVLSSVRQVFSGPLHQPLETPQDASCVYSPVPSSLPLPSLQASPVRKRKLRKHSKTTR